MRYLVLLSILLSVITMPALAEIQLRARFYPQEHIQLNTQWLEPHIRKSTGNSARMNLMLAKSRYTELQLQIPPEFQGKAVKIYLAMPLQTPGFMGFEGLEVQWQSHRGFLDGSAQPGSRSLLFEGKINQEILSGRIAFTLYIDSRFVSGDFDFKPQYIIESNTP